MKIEPRPPGSGIRIAETFEGLEILCPVKANWGLRLFIVLFLGGWLAGWAVGEVFAIRALFSADTPLVARLFLFVWLCLWTFGGIAALGFMAAALVRPRPEKLVLRPRDLVYGRGDAGIGATEKDPPSRSSRGIRGFIRRQRVRIVPRGQVGEARLEGAQDAPRLTVRFGTDDQEIGRDLPREDKEWLASLLRAWLAER